jgi:hypothetical protein
MLIVDGPAVPVGPLRATAADTDRISARQFGPTAMRIRIRSPAMGWAAVLTIQTPHAVDRNASAPDECIS